MQRLRAALLASAILAVTAGGAAAFPSAAPEDPAAGADAGTDGGGVVLDFSTLPTNSDASANSGDMARRPKAEKASLPGCSTAGPDRSGPAGTLLLAAGLVVFATASRRTRRHRG